MSTRTREKRTGFVWLHDLNEPQYDPQHENLDGRLHHIRELYKMDWKQPLERATGSGVMGALIGGAYFGASGESTLPFIGTSVPTPVVYGAVAAVSSMAMDAVGKAGASTIADSTTRMAVGAVVAGGVGSYLLDGKSQGSSFENGAVIALSVWAGDYAAGKVYGTPGSLLG